MHFFDVVGGRGTDKHPKELFPAYTLKDVSPEYREYEIVPVIYIVNHTLEGAHLPQISAQIHGLVSQISEWHFHNIPKTIQLDCDWTATTREQYFSLIDLLKEYYVVEVTIRLHQIKFQHETGIPPVDRGTLMLYNMGHLDSLSENSILESSIVQEYIHSTTSYPIALDVALPLFSQTVIQNNEKQIRLLPGAENTSLIKDTIYFQRLEEHLFEVTKDTLYKGFYLSPGYTLKLENVKEEEILNAYQIVKKSKLDMRDIIFYHLDDYALQPFNFERLIQQL